MDVTGSELEIRLDRNQRGDDVAQYQCRPYHDRNPDRILRNRGFDEQIGTCEVSVAWIRLQSLLDPSSTRLEYLGPTPLDRLFHSCASEEIAIISGPEGDRVIKQKLAQRLFVNHFALNQFVSF